MWDEFDDFFAFNESKDGKEGPASKDDTKGADFKGELEVEFMDAFKGVKVVSNSFMGLEGLMKL